MVTYNPNDRYASQRETMLRHDLKGRDIIDARVLDAMAEIPREAFVIPQYESSSYEDNPLPIGMGQTISQPYIVALMTQCLKLSVCLSRGASAHLVERYNSIAGIRFP